PQVRLRTLVASWVRREPPPDEAVRRVVRSLLTEAELSAPERGQPARELNGKDARTDARTSRGRSFSLEDRLDLLRVIALFRGTLGTQEGWFAQFDGKGVEFPLFLQTTLADLSQYHRAILLNNLTKVDLGSLLGSVAVDLIASSPNPEERLLGLYRGAVRLDA